MLQPARVKYRYSHLIRARGKATSGNTLAFGEWGLAAEEPAYITARQIEAARRAIVAYLKKGGKLWVRIFPDIGITKKAAESRMGGGKGDLEYWVAVVKRGRILFELGGVEKGLAEEAFRHASFKLPIKTKFIVRGNESQGA